MSDTQGSALLTRLGRYVLASPGRAALAVLGLVVVMLLPRLDGPGLWDPYEVRLLEAAAEPIPASELVAPKNTFKPKLPLVPISLGVRLVGFSESGGRLPMVALSLLLLLTLLLIGEWLRLRRAALLGCVVLLSTPLFVLASRLINQCHLPWLASGLAVGGLAALSFPRPESAGRDRLLGALAALVGLVGGGLGGGLLVGVVAPTMAVLLPVLLSRAPGRGKLALGLGGLALLGVALLVRTAFFQPNTGGYNPYFAGVVHIPGGREVQIDSLLKPLGFQLFPWAVLLPLAITGALSALRLGVPVAADGATDAGAEAPSAESARAAFVELLPVSWFICSYFAGTLQSAIVGDGPFTALLALALLCGQYLDRALRGERGGLIAGLIALLCAVFVGRDLLLAPEQMVSGHLGETLRWPAPLVPVGQALLGFGTCFGIILAFALGARSSGFRSRLLALSLALGIVGSLAMIQGLLPELSRHVSYRGLYTKYRKLGGGPLGLFSVPQTSSKAYGQNSVQLNSMIELMDFLKPGKPEGRSFAIVGAAELAAIDLTSRQRGQSYYVVDDSNVQFLLLTSELKPGETDLNPLRRLVTTTPPTPQIPLQITFEDKVELIGADLPTEISRGQDFLIRLYFKVKAPLGGQYKIFMHFDGMGQRFNGDHMPLDGKFTTTYWAPGTYVTDEHKVTTSRMNQAAGYYQVFMGFWPGGDGPRLRVTAGPHEADQRVRIGVIRVK